MPRRYQLQQRALSQEETRARIVEATVALHENPGPKATTISAIAERAGVQRLTVYRHFPDEDALFDACSSHWMAQNPPPDPATWSSINDPHERTRAALTALYRYFRKTSGMLTSIFRDEPDVPGITTRMASFRDYLDAITRDLAHALKPTTPRTLPTLRHIVQFQTWSSLTTQGASDKQAAALALSWVKGAGVLAVAARAAST